MPVPSRETQQERIYCAEQINIPVTFPNILKCYAKAAIRTQPYELLSWTAAYFRALANGELPPVKERLEYPPYVHSSGITPRFLKILLNQYCHDEDCGRMSIKREKTSRTMFVTLESLLGRWRGMALKDTSLYQILMTGRLLELPGDPRVCDLYRFLAIACGLMGNNLFETMIYICELVTKEPDGGSAMIPLGIFMNLYEYLADLDCSYDQRIFETGSTSVETLPQKDEGSLVRSSCYSFSSSVSSCTSGTDIFSNAKKTRAVRCRSIDNSGENTDTEESLCTVEVPSDEDEKMVNSEKTSERQTGDSAKVFEVGSEKKAFGPSDETSQGKNREAATVVETETTRIPRVESPSENTAYDDKMRSKLKVPEGKAEKLDGTAEVTRVQEEGARRRDVEMYSGMEEVQRPLAGEQSTATTSPTTAKLSSSPLPGLDPSHTSPSAPTSSSSFAKSHVSVGKDVKPHETATTGTTPQEKTMKDQDFRKTDKILDTRTDQLSQQVDGVHDENKVSNVPIENISHDQAAMVPAKNIYVERSRARRIFTKKNKKSPRMRMRETERKGGRGVRDSLEYDPTTNDDDDITSAKKQILSTEDDDEKIESKGDDSGREEPTLNSEYYVVYGEDEMDEESVEYEDGDMANYEPIGLENILEGICECLETTKDTKNVEGASISDRSSKSSPGEPLDIVIEFIERMRNIECPTATYVLPKVPGIGPSVKPEIVTAVGLWLTQCSLRQQGQVGPRNLRHFMCPNLDGILRQDDCNLTCCGQDGSTIDSFDSMIGFPIPCTMDNLSG